jgi:Putative cyclase
MSATESGPRTLPSYAELPLLDGVPSAWSVWDEPRLGALNLLTPERTARAASLIERGVSFSLNLPLNYPDPPLFNRPPAQHVIGTQRRTSKDDRLMDWNTQSSTHWDGFRHVERLATGFFGGVADDDHGVDRWSHHTVTGRALLLDVDRWRAATGRPLRQDVSDPIGADDLRGCAQAQGVTIESGDILLLRTGWLAWYRGLDAAARAEIATPTSLRTPGLVNAEETAAFLWDAHVAAIAADNPAMEVWPLGWPRPPAEVEEIRNNEPKREHEVQLHVRVLSMLGIPIGELFDLEELAEDCAQDHRYACFFSSCPLNLPGGVASPSNAIALK